MRENLRKANLVTMEMGQRARNFAWNTAERVAAKLKEDEGNWVEEGLKYVVAIVVGALMLQGLCSIFKVDLLANIKKGIDDLFNYKF
ncbi:DUF6133 family protein [[Clostridium] polysaccharolyticum]|uniref:Uncharacterized protein n=1 Tax=[Clostridium] polysaccharolyticum TaxID=29364 RepID=A0A1H9Y8H7_9FIRM|nr:DUF6133 family protein [[Clostridium] polysaccharolyticum]SES65127.1 hypothetical protein SAMN04487772_101211 [[Clostridium] polysaccharolyticum]